MIDLWEIVGRQTLPTPVQESDAWQLLTLATLTLTIRKREAEEMERLTDWRNTSGSIEQPCHYYRQLRRK